MSGRESSATEAAILLVNSGESHLRAAKLAGVAHSTLVRALRRRGVPSKQVVADPARVAGGVALVQAGVNPTQAAKMVGLARGTVVRALTPRPGPDRTS